VYASAVEVAGRVTYGVTNIGVKPTVGGTIPLAETWIPAFSGDLYGQPVPVRPVAFLRPEVTFGSLDELQAQILADGETARRRMTERDGIRAILFDFDDTLQHRPAAFWAFAKDFVERHFPEWPADKQEAMAKEMARLNGSGYVDYRAFLDEVKAAFDWQDAPDNDTLLAEVQRHFPLFTTLLPGVAEGLAALREQGYLLGIITNGRRLMQNRKLDVSGLRPLLDIAVVSGDEGVHKPDPELFRRTAARLGLPPEACVYVGDHPVNDMEGAKAAGMTGIFMQASGHFLPPAGVPVVHNMAELVEMVTKL
jgi:putative hydrolase of the HAD superfamily